MGKIRPQYIRDIAEKVYKHSPEQVTTDFEENKKLLVKITNIDSKILRNRVAGLLTNIKKNEGRIIIPPKKGKKPRDRKKRKKKNNSRKRKRKRRRI